MTSDPRGFMGAQPDPPKRGIFTRIIRRFFREIVAVFIFILEQGNRFGAILLRTEYKVSGGCKKRGACCHHVLLEWSPFLDDHPFIAKLVLWKLTRFYSLYDRGYTWEIQEGLMARVLGCHALLPDGRCGEYRTRPMFCRTYPELPLVGKPMVLKDCGYEFVRRDGVPEEPEQLIQIGRRIR